MTLKAFRELLNRRYGFTDMRFGSRGSFGASKRLYGDYLYRQDRDMFNDLKRRYEEGHAPTVEELDFVLGGTQ